MASSRARVVKTERTHKRERVAADFTEDFGSRVFRNSPPATAGSHEPKGFFSAIGQTLLSEVELSVTRHDPSGFAETPSPPRPSSVVSSPTLPRISSQVADVAAVSSPMKRIPPSEPLPVRPSPGQFEGGDSREGLVGKKQKVKKVKRKNPDEIDDIFGF